MDIIDLAREFGEKIQQNELYLKFKIASQINDEDEDLQNLIKDFNLKRINVSNELSKTDRDEKKIELLNKELQKCYNDIMNNENMINYNKAKAEFDELMRKINLIIMRSANGDNPQDVNIDISNSGCSGECSGCAGCN